MNASAVNAASVLRDRRVGRRLAATGCRALAQAESGGTPMDNARRVAQWRNRFAEVPIEATLYAIGEVAAGPPPPISNYAARRGE